MKLGVRKISHAPASSVAPISALPPGSPLKLSAILTTGSFTELPFTPETADISENWNYDDNGKYSDYSLTASLRAGKETYRPALAALTGRKHVFLVELINGEKFLIGSPEFVPTFTYSDGISGISTSGFTFKIALKSLHGAFLVSQN